MTRRELIRAVRDAIEPEVERLADAIVARMERALKPTRTRPRPSVLVPDEATQERARQALARLELKVKNA